ncbi:MAG: ASKHA domain-containing protein, partial [Candidatus Adiutrix sp.]|nr:ASKHA domain-containing protein [Candidatus Adiutrix sp.]
MSEHTIIFMPENVRAAAKAGETLIDVAARANLHINASCGGEGVCGRCRVELLEGALAAEPGLYLSAEEYAGGLRLACRARVAGDAVVNIPLESRADASVYAAAKAEEATAVETLAPLATEISLSLTPPSPEDNLADYDRLRIALEAEDGLENAEMELAALLEMPEALRAGSFSARFTIFTPPALNGEEKTAAPKIISVQPGASEAPLYALALDIGTTTVWARLVNLETGAAEHSRGDLNGQIAFGEDVISRIVYASKDGGLARLKEKVVANINGLIDQLDEEVEGSRRRIALVAAAGNTTMSHLFTGLDPKSIRLAPYVPAAASWPVLQAGELGLNLRASVPVLIYPSVSSYVGGDIVAGVLASGLYKRPELTLFIDVGTNGEIVVGNRDWMTCAACSAGPAFEGGGVKFGMRAAPGAIDQFYFDRAAGTHRLSVIGGQKPAGICGSGLIN